MNVDTLPELLAPAGNMEKLETAILYGADAVYLGGDSLNLRAGAGGFNPEALKQGIALAHRAGVKVYFTLNVYPRESMLPQVKKYIDALGDLAPDGLIAADPGVIRLVRRELPHIPLHVSTQANTSNSESIRFWGEYGAKRVNVARELRSMELLEMLAIARKEMPEMELEVFVHGAMCMAVSGRCYMSAYLNDRPGNMGECSHPCRYEYRPQSVTFEERTRPGEGLWEIRDYDIEASRENLDFDTTTRLPLTTSETSQNRQRVADPALTLGAEERRWTKIFAAQDLCLIHYVEWFTRMKVASIKLEGRTKSSAYLAQVVDAYKTALNDIGKGHFRPEKYLSELVNAASRPLTTGFFNPEQTGPIALPPDAAEKRPVLARVLEEAGQGKWLVQVKSQWKTHRDIELLVPGMQRPRLSTEGYGVAKEGGEGLGVTNPGQKVFFHCEHPDIKPGMFIRQPWDLEELD